MNIGVEKTPENYNLRSPLGDAHKITDFPVKMNNSFHLQWKLF